MLKLHITSDQPNPTYQPNATREILVLSEERYEITEHKAMLYLWIWESLTLIIRIAITTLLSSTTEHDTLKLQR